MTSLYRMEDFGSFLMALLAQATSSTFAFVETERETLAVTEPGGGTIYPQVTPKVVDFWPPWLPVTLLLSPTALYWLYLFMLVQCCLQA